MATLNITGTYKPTIHIKGGSDMARNVDIGGKDDLFLGEDKSISMEVLDRDAVPVDITGWTILMVLRLSDANADASPILTSSSATISGTYDADPEVNTQRAVITLTDTQTVALTRTTGYRHSWKRTDDGFETILAYGDFTLTRLTQI